MNKGITLFVGFMLVIAFSFVGIAPLAIAEEDEGENKEKVLREKVVNYLSKRNDTQIKVKDLWKNREEIKEKIKNSDLTDEEKKQLNTQFKKLVKKLKKDKAKELHLKLKIKKLNKRLAYEKDKPKEI
jgi:regulatory protein YycH of two-component signal transduction system YycFG